MALVQGMRVVGIVSLLGLWAGSAQAESDPGASSRLRLDPWPDGWGMGPQRCLAMPGVGDRASLRDPDEARLVTGVPDGDELLDRVEVPSEFRWLPTYGAPVAVLCPLTDVLPEELFAELDGGPGFRDREIALGYWGARSIPLIATEPSPPRSPALTMERPRATAAEVAFSVQFADDADRQSLVHLIATSEAGLPVWAAPASDDPADWREALRESPTAGTLHQTLRVFDQPGFPVLAATYEDTGVDDTCWVAVVEGPDTSWSPPSDVQCVPGYAGEQNEGACGGVALVAALPLLVLPGLRRRRDHRGEWR